MKLAVVLRVGFLAASTAIAVVSSECPVGCPMDIEEVCGSDGKTYSNVCILGIASCNNPSANITLLFEGNCADGPPSTPDPTTAAPSTTAPTPTTPAPTDKCHRSCTKEFVPVCGSNGKTYANYCGLLKAKCRIPTLYQLHPGTCKSKSKTKI